MNLPNTRRNLTCSMLETCLYRARCRLTGDGDVYYPLSLGVAQTDAPPALKQNECE